VIVLAYPFLYALSPYSWLVTEPRYLTLLAPFLALLVAAALPRRLAAGAAAAAVAFALSLTGLLIVEHQHKFDPIISGDTQVPEDIGPLVGLLRAHGTERGFADYWIAHRVDFETGERIILAPTGATTRYTTRDGSLTPVPLSPGRYPPYLARVLATKRRAAVFATAAIDDRARRDLAAAGYRPFIAGGFTVYLPAARAAAAEHAKAAGS
jgi:hypothetical protein